VNRIPLVGASVVSVQLGAAIAAALFDRVGPPGTVLLRQLLAAILLLAVVRPAIRGRTAADWRTVGAFGLVLATMNVCFYEAVARLPLGIAVTIELFGPLGLAAALSRTRREAVWVALAAIGVILLGGVSHDLDPVGVAFALAAAVGWASYILLSRRTGHRFQGVDGVAFALAIAALVIAPLGIVTGGARLLDPSVLARGSAVALLSAAIPFALEITALRSVGPRAFGVIMSTSPAVAATMGWLVLHEPLGAVQAAAIACVVAASAGTAFATDVAA
jgi:inner membrane transporter RhtA